MASQDHVVQRVKEIAALLSLDDKHIASTFPHLHVGGVYVHKAIDAGIPSFIDHTLLKSQATEAEIQQLCKEAIQHKFKAVCVNGSHAAYAHSLLQQAGKDAPQLAVVVGFPLGASSTAVKKAEAADAVSLGASEIDMVINVGLIKEGHTRYQKIYEEVKGVVFASGKAAVKVILETAYLSDVEIIDASILCAFAGAHFVKTSTGFATVPAGKASGATPEHVKLMREVVGDRLGVKASGGVRTTADAHTMIAAGASRIGTSNGVAIVQGIQSTNSY